MNILRQLLAAALLAAWGTTVVAADEQAARHSVTLTAADAFECGQGAFGVRLSDAKTVVLYDRNLVEDDGPGVSATGWIVPAAQRAPAEDIVGRKRVKKVLHVERPEALEAWLYVPLNVAVEVNGTRLETRTFTEPYSMADYFPAVPLTLLKKGDNEVVLYARTDVSQPEPPAVKMAKPEDILRNAPDRKDRPRRSFTSSDGGLTWQPAAGEYTIRLQLVQYAPTGTLLSPVIDLGRAAGDTSPLVTGATLKTVKVAAEAETPKGTSVELAVRTGSSPVYEAKLWGDWHPAGAAVPAGHRYVQWRAVLMTTDGRLTPALKTVTVEAEATVAPPPAWAAKVTIKETHNEEIRYTSLPFEYEDPRHPKAVALREKYKLDEVVSGSKSELEKFVKLRNWVAHQWKFLPPSEYYPAWDADDIMTHQTGFCVQYAIAFMQCAISLGYQARFVFGVHYATGHEVCEIWSNEYGKWICMDPRGNFHCLNARTGVPLSQKELHQLLLRTYYPDGRRPDFEHRTKGLRTSDEIAVCQGLDLTPSPQKRAADGRFTVVQTWLNMWMMPRNNFFARPYPVPLVQGFHWDWSDYVVWEDAQTPRKWLYRNFTSRQADRDWTINQVRFEAAYGPAADSVTIQMGTVTPYFETFLVNADGQGWKAAERTFAWRLHEGRNRLEMRVRNRSGIEGPVSFLELDRTP